MVIISSARLPAEVTGPEAWSTWDCAGIEGTMKLTFHDPVGPAEIPETNWVWFRVTVIPFSLEAKPKPANL